VRRETLLGKERVELLEVGSMKVGPEEWEVQGQTNTPDSFRTPTMAEGSEVGYNLGMGMVG